MPTFQRVEVLFGVPPETESMKTVSNRNSGVQAIFLGGSEKQFLKGFDPAKVKKITAPPAGVTLEINGTAIASSEATGGPGEVCYLIGGQLHCWET